MKLSEYFDKTIGSVFKEFDWHDKEIAALRGAFYTGAQYALNNRDDADEIMEEVEQFQAEVARLTNAH